MEGVPEIGIIDNIAIFRADLFYHILETAGSVKNSLKPADLKLAHTTKSQLLWMDRPTCTLALTAVYVKLVAPDQLLLSEAMCCQSGIVSCHVS